MAASWLESLPQCGAVTLIYVRSETTLQRSEESLLQCLLAKSEWKCQIKVRRQRGRKVASLLRCAARNRERMKLSPHVNWRIVDTTNWSTTLKLVLLVRFFTTLADGRGRYRA